jgi:transcriptional regulator with XRE-family HTH domain
MARKRNADPRPDARSPEVKRLLGALKDAIRLLEYTNRDVERKLGLSGSYLSRLFSGLVDLKVDHIVSISGAVGLEPEEMFQFAFPKRKRSPTVAALRVREALAQAGELEPEPLEELEPDRKRAPSSELEQAMERLMARTIQRLLGRLA